MMHTKPEKHMARNKTWSDFQNKKDFHNPLWALA